MQPIDRAIKMHVSRIASLCDWQDVKKSMQMSM
jgi:hypothetical protein